jgi:putative intracellular protease/amidase
VTDGNIITACGVGAAFEFGFEILKHLTDSQKSQEIKKTMKY